MDAIDLKILKAVMRDARVNWSELAKKLGVSNPTIADRVRRLEERGVIKGYSALINPEEIGSGLAAMIAVSLEKPSHRAGFLKLVQSTEMIQECHHIAGDDDFLLKVRCGSAKELENLISEKIKSLPGVYRTRTTIVLSTVKETPILPVRED
ncbi:MAG: Lrp/AsnC family transcriptional regulator [Acidobacteria bacterium]|nr:MAG: Lrp/AsnC family transcriptional regulator [Acidobacteriota bacterium]